jgi:group II intron reverse transcriptase/maturase
MTVHSDRESGPTKLDRVRYRAKASPKTVFNNLAHVLSIELLHEAFASISGSKAIGIDKVTKGLYRQDLDANIIRLHQEIRTGRYRPRAARIVQIPKEDGSTRPLAISCFEDKIVQWAVAKILEVIYEPLFLPCSYGFRPEHNCHEALRALSWAAYNSKEGALIEIDIRKCFNRIPHDHMLTFLEKKIKDKRLLRLIWKLMTMPILEDGIAQDSDIGCPQGSIVSPILCNIFLHYVVDEWFHEISKTHLSGKTELIRYADDMVFIFERKVDAERVFRVLNKRLNKFGLEMHEAKSALLPFGRMTASLMSETKQKMPTFMFLGFTCYWGRALKGFWRLKYTSRKDRYTATLKQFRKLLRENLNTEDEAYLMRSIIRRMKGWINYHAISDNGRRVNSFILNIKRILLRWFNRRSQRKPMTWEKLAMRLEELKFPKSFKTTSMFTSESKS